MKIKGTRCCGCNCDRRVFRSDKRSKDRNAQLHAVESDGSLRLKWTGLDNVDYYEIYRNTVNDTNYPKIDEVSDATSYIDDTVKAGTKYYYLVRPVFNDGTAGEYSKPISGVALGKTNLTKIKAKSGKKITLTWKRFLKQRDI